MRSGQSGESGTDMPKKRGEKDRYLQIIEAMGEGVLLISRKHRIALANSSAQAMLGQIEPLKGKRLEDLFAGNELEAHVDAVFMEKKQRKFRITSYRDSIGEDAIVRGKGREKQYEFCITHLDGKYAVATFSDVTMLERLEVVRQDFVSNVSHELKTPLTAISGFAETLAEESLSEEERRGFARIIQKNANHMQGIIADLLLLTSLDRSELASTMERTTDSRILQEVRAYTQYKAESKDITVTYSPSDETVLCNESLVVQALINLVVNAISYSPRGSAVSVRTRRKGEMLEFAVSDKGYGISDADLPRIFERFYRVDKARSRESGGTGLGLSIVRHIAIIHKGTIKAESRLGEGSVFTLSIPVS